MLLLDFMDYLVHQKGLAYEATFKRLGRMNRKHKFLKIRGLDYFNTDIKRKELDLAMEQLTEKEEREILLFLDSFIKETEREKEELIRNNKLREDEVKSDLKQLKEQLKTKPQPKRRKK